MSSKVPRVKAETLSCRPALFAQPREPGYYHFWGQNLPSFRRANSCPPTGKGPCEADRGFQTGGYRLVALVGADDFSREGGLAGHPLRMSSATATEDVTVLRARKRP
jgi:hypothetical protein